MSVDVIEQLPANAAVPTTLGRRAPDAARAPASIQLHSNMRLLFDDPRRGTWLETLRELEESWQEASEEDWRGEGEVAMSARARELAHWLLRALRDRFPRPGVAPDPQGGVAVEWHFEKHRSVAATISNEGVLHYSVLDRERTEYGSEPIRGEIPASFFAALSRLRGAT